MVASTQPHPAEVAAARRLLGVAPSADKDAIRSAFRAAARTHHPDRGGDPERFAGIERAYRTVLASADAQVPPQAAKYRVQPMESAPTAQTSVISRRDRQRQSVTRTFADILASRLR